MVLPKPNSKETRPDFLSRCLADPTVKAEFGTNQQQLAYCFSIYTKLHEDFIRILNNFLEHFEKPREALTKFLTFVDDNELDVAKPYNVKAQYESFQWLQDQIEYIRKDKEAKYYKVRALTCSVSMNENDYLDADKIASATPTMNFRPVNINHDHNRFVDFPRTRIEMTGFESLTLEALLRVDNRDDWLQRAIDQKDIVNPSIEALKNVKTGDLTFKALALLEKGVALPGIPNTSIEPLFLNESIGESLKSDMLRFKDPEILTFKDPIIEKDASVMRVKGTLKDGIIDAKIFNVSTQYPDRNPIAVHHKDEDPNRAVYFQAESLELLKYHKREIKLLKRDISKLTKENKALHKTVDKHFLTFKDSK